MDQNVMKMRPLLNGIEIDPGKTVTFEPGGYHVRFVDLNRPRKQGEKVPATLEFAKAGRVQVEFLVEGIGATHDGEAAHNAEPIPGMGH